MVQVPKVPLHVLIYDWELRNCGTTKQKVPHDAAYFVELYKKYGHCNDMVEPTVRIYFPGDILSKRRKLITMQEVYRRHH